MKKRCIFVLVCVLFGSSVFVNSVHAQKIVKMVQNYVLIDTDNNLGKLDDELQVYRYENNRKVEVGTVQIRKFSQGKTAAKILSAENGNSIRLGDLVEGSSDDLFDLFNSDAPAQPETQKRSASAPTPNRGMDPYSTAQKQSAPAPQQSRSVSHGSASSGNVRMKSFDGQPKLLMVGIGAKNPTFDESRFTHLNFVYTPGLESQAKLGGTGKSALALMGGGATREIYKGTPEFLADWWDETDIRYHAVLFDANGVGAWEGWIDRREEIMESVGYGDDKNLGKMVKEIVRKGKTSKLKDKKFNPKKSDALLNNEMPDFEVVSAGNVRTSINRLIQDGSPTLVMFFQIPPDADLQSAKESGAGKSSGMFLKSMVQATAGSDWENMFKRIEGQLFNHTIRD